MTTAIATFVGGGSTPGMSLILAANYDLSNFRIALARITASETVFSGSWNFLHEQTATFTGSGALTRRTLLTQRGPLVKGWGDTTPASIEDVTVKVNGTAVDVGYVNPYIGQVMTLIPIPLMPAGAITVTVDYKWFYNPIMDIIGLNTNGLVLNKWNRPLGHHFPPAHGEQIQTLPAYPKGVPDLMRFQMSVVLGPSERPDPLLIGHRFHALERDYTASLNDPTLMMLNQNPHSIAVPGLESIPEGETVSYEGLQTPLAETPSWLLAGVDTGAIDAGQGTYTLVDANNGDSSSPLPAFITSTLNPPYDLRLVSVPSFVDTRTLLFAIDGTEATATFWGQAATVSSTAQTWNFTGGKTLLVKVDGGAVQTVTFIDADFFNPAAASAMEVSAVINAQIAGGTAVPSTSIGLYSNTKGTGSIIQVTGGTANAAGLLEFSTVAQTGDGSVADMSAVTLSEVHTLIEAAIASCYVATPLPFTIYTRSTGGTSTIQVLSTSTAGSRLGLDLNLHTGSDSGDTTAFYYRNVDLSFPSSVVCATRFKVNSPIRYHGIFTGVGFGFHNNHSVWAIGCLLINGVKHIGFLTDAANPQDQASWEIGPSVSGTVISAANLTAITTALPVGVRAGSRFQIFTGGQVGVYTLASVVHQTTGMSTLTITGNFPANYKLWGNRDISMVFEIEYDTVLSYQLTASPDTGGATLYVSGGLSGSFLSTTSASVFPDPAQTGLMLSAEGEGQAFWGSYSREAENSSTWSFFRYGIQPDQRRISGRGLVVASMMSDIPREDPNSVWFRTQGFGFDRIETLTNRLLLKNGCASDALDFSYGYGRIEPFLVSGVNVDVDATFQMDSCTQGSGDLQIQVQNTKKQVVFSPLTYVDPSGILPRRLISSPQLSASCLFIPTDEAVAWSAYNSPTSQIEVKTLTIWGPGGYQADLNLTNADYPDTGGRILEGHLAITQFNPARPIEVVLAANAGGVTGPARAVVATWRVVGGVPLVTLCSDITVPIIDYAFDWTAGDFHTYRLVLDESLDSVILSIDDMVYPPGALSAFDPAADNTRMRFGIDGAGTLVETKWDYVHVHVTPPANAKRTLGIWLGGDLDDIDQWEIPRTDSSSLPNSSADPAVVIQDMDWQNEMDVRIHWDAGWGVTVLRPDLPPPPYFTGDFATEITEPSAGWINVETGNLPANTTGDIFGSVKFGALRKESISQQRWREIRYRLYNWPSLDYRSGQHMVLNQSHVITSGEPTLDTTPETITVTSLDNKHLTLLPGRIYARQIYSVVDNGTLISSTYWTFNTETQMLTLVPDTLGNVVTFSGDHVPVTVVFSPGKPYTTTYLDGQPLLDSTTLLNEGTPPFYKHQIAPDVSTVQFGTQINNPMGTLNDAPPDFILNDPYRFVSFVEEGDALYTNLTPIEVDNDGSVDMIQSICDEWSAMEFSGDFFTEWLAPKPQDAFSQGAGMNIMMISGGAKAVGGLVSGGGLGGGSDGIGAVLYPSLGVEVTWVLNLSAVITDTTGPVEQDLAEVDVLNEYADEVPPTGHATDLLAPDGTPTIGGLPLAPGVHGHGNIYLTFTVDGSYAHIGPWGGMDSLTPGAQEIIGPEIAGAPVGLPFTHGSFLYGSNAAQPTGVPANAGMILVGGAVLPATGTYSVGIDAAN
jgi:hypothetical protein